jgi:hypothetical protein
VRDDKPIGGPAPPHLAAYTGLFQADVDSTGGFQDRARRTAGLVKPPGARSLPDFCPEHCDGPLEPVRRIDALFDLEGAKEDKSGWSAFLRHLVDRGLTGCN